MIETSCLLLVRTAVTVIDPSDLILTSIAGIAAARMTTVEVMKS